MNNILKAKIIEKFGTQADFAQAIKTEEAIVSRVVRGRRILNSETKQIWADALGCKPKDIFKE